MSSVTGSPPVSPKPKPRWLRPRRSTSGTTTADALRLPRSRSATVSGSTRQTSRRRVRRPVSHRRLGPFRVIQVIGRGAYKLELPPRLSRLHPVFPVVKLELAEDNPFKGRLGYSEPALVLPEAPGDAPEWEVNEILDAKVRW